MSSHADTIRLMLDRFRSMTVKNSVGARQLDEADAALDALLAENQRLREALEFIVRDSLGPREYEWVIRLAREALAGDT